MNDISYYLFLGIWGPYDLPTWVGVSPTPPGEESPVGDTPTPLGDESPVGGLPLTSRKRPYGSVKTLMPQSVSRCGACSSTKKVSPHELEKEGGISALIRVGWIVPETWCVLSITSTFYRLGLIHASGHIQDPVNNAYYPKPSDWLNEIYNDLVRAGDTELDSPLEIIGEQAELKTYAYRFISFPSLSGVNLHQMANYYYHCKHTKNFDVDISREFQNIPHIPYDVNKASVVAIQKQNDTLRETVKRLSAFCVMKIDPLRFSDAIKKAYIERFKSSDQHITSYSVLDVAMNELLRVENERKLLT